MLKNITYKTLKERDCHGDLNRVCGDVRHCTVEIPFHLFIEIEGARDCDICEVEDAIVAGEFDKLICKNQDGTFDKLLEKVVIKVRAKVVRIKHLKVDAKDVTPDKLECPTHSKVDTKPGLDIPEEKDDCCY